MCLYPTPYYSCALSKLSDAVSNAHWLTFPNLTMLQPSCMPVLQLKISKLRYIRIQRWKAKRNNIYIYIICFIYTKYTYQSSQIIQKKNLCIVCFQTLGKTSLEKSFFRHLESLKVLRIRTELRRRRTPLPTRLRRLFPIEASHWWPDQLIPGGCRSPFAPFIGIP